MLKSPLAKEDMDLLCDIVRKRVPELLPIIEHTDMDILSLTDKQLDKLINAIDNEMSEIGYQSDWEPNLLGRRLEAIGDILVAVRYREQTMVKISNYQMELLREIILKRAPSLLRLLNYLNVLPLTNQQRQDLREIVYMEFCDTGLRKDDEPNQRGWDLKDLIDLLGHL